MFTPGKNDDGLDITQYVGACSLDLSLCKSKIYHLPLRDASTRPPLLTGQISISFSELSNVSEQLTSHKIQSTKLARQLFSSAESNLNYIQGFGKNGVEPVVPGLRLVHSPYYVNFLGMTLPSGAFCMIPSSGNIKGALRSYNERLSIALSRNTMKAREFVSIVENMMTTSIKSKHLRCLSVLADFLTLHAKIQIRYMPDVQLTPSPRSTERWDIPREPRKDGTTSFNGDCEDYAREIYQHCKELRTWIQPKLNATALESAVALLHLYVPTIEQGAVDKNAHSKYITYDATYRNHIWAALHPRHGWAKNCSNALSMERLYRVWPQQKCEKTLPMVHLEGTGEVYPVVTTRNPGFIVKMQSKQLEISQKYPRIGETETTDISLQCKHRSDFYKYPIACMTDIFAGEGMLDFTYFTDNKYGVSIYDWARGKYHLRPSCVHSEETMHNIRSVLTCERPIPTITTKSVVERSHNIKEGYALRYGQKMPFEYVPKEARLAIYNIGGQRWHEIYFPLGRSTGSASSAEIEHVPTNLLLI